MTEIAAALMRAATNPKHVIAFLRDQFGDVTLDGLGRDTFAVGTRNPAGEEIFKFEQTALARQIFVGRDAANGRFVHSDRIGDGA